MSRISFAGLLAALLTAPPVALYVSILAREGEGDLAEPRVHFFVAFLAAAVVAALLGSLPLAATVRLGLLATSAFVLISFGLLSAIGLFFAPAAVAVLYAASKVSSSVPTRRAWAVVTAGGVLALGALVVGLATT